MKKVIITSSALVMVLSLSGCNTMNSANHTVGTGVKYGAETVGKGVGVVVHTSSAVGHGIGNVVSTGAGLVTGKPATYHHKVIYHNGHKYVVQNGKYVLVH